MRDLIQLFLSFPWKYLKWRPSILWVITPVVVWAFCLERFFFSSSRFLTLCDKILMILSISSHFSSGDYLALPKKDTSSLPLLFSIGSDFPLDFPTEVKFASTSSASIWSWSKLRDFLSLRVKPKSDSKALKISTWAVAGGGFISLSRLLHCLLNLFINSEISSFGFFLKALKYVRRYPWFLFSHLICVKGFSSSFEIVMDALCRDLNYFLASPSRDCTKSLMTTSSCSTFRFSTKSQKVSMCLFALF